MIIVPMVTGVGRQRKKHQLLAEFYCCYWKDLRAFVECKSWRLIEKWTEYFNVKHDVRLNMMTTMMKANKLSQQFDQATYIMFQIFASDYVGYDGSQNP